MALDWKSVIFSDMEFEIIDSPMFMAMPLVIGEMSCKMAQDISRQVHAPGNATSFCLCKVAAETGNARMGLGAKLWKNSSSHTLCCRKYSRMILAPTDLSFKLMNYPDSPRDIKG
jgi:hypothetical protein